MDTTHEHNEKLEKSIEVQNVTNMAPEVKEDKELSVVSQEANNPNDMIEDGEKSIVQKEEVTIIDESIEKVQEAESKVVESNDKKTEIKEPQEESGKSVSSDTVKVKEKTPLPEKNDTKTSNEGLNKEVAPKTRMSIPRKRKNVSTPDSESIPTHNIVRSKRKKSDNTSDEFCWRCHKESVEAHCSACPRSWHRKCMGGTPPSSVHNWICGECATILRAENAETRSTAMAQLSVDQLCMLLKHVVEKMREYPGSEPFWKPVEISEAPNYLDYVVKPMDLSLLESNVRSKLYGSTDAFMADAKWIQHNCIVFNTCGGVYADTSKLTNAAKQMIKVARQEVSEIEACPDCYAHGRNLPRPQPSWFIEPCRRPHPLVWAKLKGFPFWPAKAMPRVNSQGFVDVRFFGAHDRAWVSPRDLYLYSENPPQPLPRKRKVDMDECVREITRHCRKLELVFGQFKFAPPKVQYNPNDPTQIKLMLPNYDPLQPSHIPTVDSVFLKKKILLRKRNTPVKVKAQNESGGDNSTSKSADNSSVEPETKISDVKQNEKKQLNLSDDVQIVTNSGHNVSPVNIKQDTSNEESKEQLSLGDIPLTGNNQDIKKEKDETSESNINTVEDKIKASMTQINEKNNGQSAKSPLNTLQSVLKKEVTIINDLISTAAVQKKTPPKSSSAKGVVSPNKGTIQKIASKSPKSTCKVYKPKTRMVDKLNAEKALKYISERKQDDKSESMHLNSANDTHNESFKAINKSTAAVTNIFDSKPHSINSTNAKVKMNQSTVNSVTQQSMTVLLKNKEGVDVSRSSTRVPDGKKNTSISASEKQEIKGHQQKLIQKRESKARKSFPNRPPNHLQSTSQSSSIQLSSTDLILDTSTSEHRTENPDHYELLPPEAGPLSAHLYHSAQELAKKMAQLMEDAYREAAQETRGSDDDTVDSHQATVHFLKLQIERMRWQHQQQLAELKHNTDRILREMRASLEAEKLRAIEETRREAEEEKMRCIEETKRKQWCANCGREALFYCCWNTAYCDYPCQQSHWSTHMRTCAQQPSFTTIVTSSASSSHQQQNDSTKAYSPAGRVCMLPHSKSSGISTSLYLTHSRSEDSPDSS